MTARHHASQPDFDPRRKALEAYLSSIAARRRRTLALGIALPIVLLAGLYLINPRFKSYAGTAVAALIEAVRSDDRSEPSPDHALMIKASELMWQARWAEARNIYIELLIANPNSPELSYGLACCYHQLDDFEGAIDQNLKAIDAPELAPDALYNLAGEYAMTGRKYDALDAYHQSLRIGFRDFKKIASDPNLDPIRDMPGFAVPPKPKRHAFTTRNGTTLEYDLVLPMDFNPLRAYPALIGFTRSRQKGNDVNFALDNYWGMQAHYHGWIAVSPIAPEPTSFAYTDDYKLVPELLDHLARRFHIEGDKFHLAGFSNGGTTSFRLATEFPQRFQSVTAFPCYEISDENLQRLDRLDGMKISLMYGEKDGGPSVDATDRIHQRLRKLGVPSTLTMYADEGHVVTSLMGDRFMSFLDTLRPPGAPWRMQRQMRP